MIIDTPQYNADDHCPATAYPVRGRFRSKDSRNELDLDECLNALYTAVFGTLLAWMCDRKIGYSRDTSVEASGQRV